MEIRINKHLNLNKKYFLMNLIPTLAKKEDKTQHPPILTLPFTGNHSCLGQLCQLSWPCPCPAPCALPGWHCQGGTRSRKVLGSKWALLRLTKTSLNYQQLQHKPKPQPDATQRRWALSQPSSTPWLTLHHPPVSRRKTTPVSGHAFAISAHSSKITSFPFTVLSL